MTGKTIAYWATTGLLSLAMLASGAAYLTGAMDEGMAHLGYPAHFIVLLGTWKLLVAPALLAPGFAKLKELAYAGLFFTLTGAAFAHAAVGDSVAEIAPPLVMLAMMLTSWALHRTVRFGAESGSTTSATPAAATA